MSESNELTDEDEGFLRRAIAIAAQSRADGHAPYGSLLVDADGTVLAEEHNTTRADRDITAHPELKLARWAARELDLATAAGTTLYTSCQPCGMCAGAIDRSGLRRVVYAFSNAQFAELDPDGLFVSVPQLGPGLLRLPREHSDLQPVRRALYEEARAVLEGFVE